MSTQFRVKLLDPKLSKPPTRAYVDPKATGMLHSFGAVGYDVYCYGDHTLSPGETKIIPIGFAAEISPGYGAFIWDRSGLGAKGIHTFHQLRIVPFAGVIDNDYRNQWGVVLHNFSPAIVAFNHGDRVAQIVLLQCETPEPEILEDGEELTPTSRGMKGFGSSDTGKMEQRADAVLSRNPGPSLSESIRKQSEGK